MSEAEKDRRPYSVLLVDDEKDTLLSLAEFLERGLKDAQVLAIASGKDALQVLEKQSVDLLIVDYRMPVMDGLQVLHRARQMAPDVDRIMLTAYPDVNVAIRAINDGEVARFFTKPFDPETLLDAVRALRRARLKRGDRSRAFARGMDTLRRARDEP